MKGLVFKVPLSESVKQWDSGMEVNHHAKVIKEEIKRERERERERETERQTDL